MTYKINIKLDDATLRFMLENDLWLRVYKAAVTSAPVSCPLWYTTKEFSNNVALQWTTDHYGFINSRTSMHSLEPGYLMAIDEAGVVTTNTRGMDGVFQFHNRRLQLGSCGVAQVMNDVAGIYAITQLTGDGCNIIRSKETLLLVFESGYLEPGTIVQHTLNPSLLITMQQAEVHVSYSAVTSWNTESNPLTQVFARPVGITDQLREQF